MTIGFVNGKFISIDSLAIPIEDRGHQFGDGVYDVIRVYNGRPLMLQEHLLRLEKSADAIDVQLNFTLQELEKIVEEGLTRSGLLDCEVYIQVTRGISPRQHLFPNVSASTTMTIRPARTISDTLKSQGVSVTLRQDERWANCYIKSLNLLPNILAKQSATNEGFHEAIFVKDEYITEGSSSNVFAVKDGVLYTPPISRKILPGITRATVIQLAKENGHVVKEEELKPNFLIKADEMFITSTTMEVLPVSNVDGTAIGNGVPGELTLKLSDYYRRLYK